MADHHANPRVLRAAGRSLAVLEMLGLAVIAFATLVAGVEEVAKMIGARKVTLADLLLLFIYLEVLTMVAVYLESGALPIRMPLYIAMVALARHLILDMKEMSEWAIIATSVAILVIAIAVLAIRFGHVRFPYEPLYKDSTHRVKNE
ncbi:MAG: phosphate-starvation-inducible protein PsiE [Bdellovibrio bacteriovorus]